MLHYLDRTFCNCHDCEVECYRRFYGTSHEENAKRVGLPVSMASFGVVGPCGWFVRQREDAKEIGRNTRRHRTNEPEANKGPVG